ncbi:hypothetical protein COB80_00335 [Candidatus Kaiserbacteria bacterium]|nr:MAG: hypothetical protein COB80_00335 [Candidatus Kaiserbacteria bacterium]
MKYKVEHRILTLIQNAVAESKPKPYSFSHNGIKFSHWKFSFREGWKTDFWMATGNIEADNGIDAINEFRTNLFATIPIVAFIGQSYTDYLREPWLVTKTGSNIGVYLYMEDRNPVGLMFMDEHKKALSALSNNLDIPKEFYLYWKDAINSIGYSGKLMLMFSALEALIKNKCGKKDWDKLDLILGTELREYLFAPNKGLRHRLVHGEYLSDLDIKSNYIDEIHKKVMSYFNTKILKEDLLNIDVKNPQRHLYGNKEGGMVFLERLGEKDLTLRNALKEYEGKDIVSSTKNFGIIRDGEVKKAF